jgi:3-phenylpropionate/trans-cinnamate dioxygenase ferredoxin subunit
MSRHVVAAVTEVPLKGSKLVSVKGREIVLFNVNGSFHALLNKCPHEGAALCHGVRVGAVESDHPGTYRYSRPREMIRCPWHGWEFDISTGQSWCDPGSFWVRTYPTTVEPGSELVKGPFVVESFPVSVEDDYIVIEL